MSVVINGGGIIGAVLALSLSKWSKGRLNIHLIEKKSPFCNDFTNISPQIIALSRGSYLKLMHLNKNIICSSCSAIIKKIEISEFGKYNKVFIDAQAHRLPELGYVIKLNTLRKNVFNILRKQSSITIHCPAKLQAIKRTLSRNIISLDNGYEISSRLIIAADGARSQLVQNCGIKFSEWNYHQVAITVKIITEISCSDQAFEKFTASGSLALFPMSDGYSFIIWCVSYKEKEKMVHWNKSKFLWELQNIFGWRLGKILNIEQFQFYNLSLIYAEDHISHRLALVGNAAQNLHPIAGQGFNLGLRDVTVLSRIIVEAFNKNIDIGSKSVLIKYEKNRYIDQYRIIKITDGLIHLFNNNCFPLVFFRSLGFFCLNNSLFLQNLLIRIALR